MGENRGINRGFFVMPKPGILTAVCGRPRCGKGQAVQREISRKQVSLVWDPKGDREDYKNAVVRCFNIPQLCAVVERVKSGQVIYTGALKDLPLFTKVAWIFARKFGDKCAVVFDEMASTSNPGKATGEYGDFLRQSLYLGHDIYVIAQRAAEADKTAFGNASRFLFVALGTAADKKYIAEQTGLALSDVEKVRAVFAENPRDSTFELVTVVKDLYWYKERLDFKTGKARYRVVIQKKSLF